MIDALSVFNAPLMVVTTHSIDNITTNTRLRNERPLVSGYVLQVFLKGSYLDCEVPQV